MTQLRPAPTYTDLYNATPPIASPNPTPAISAPSARLLRRFTLATLRPSSSIHTMQTRPIDSYAHGSQ